MSDLGDDFRAMREASREKRASNREFAPQILTDAAIAFESKNGGAHLIVKHEGVVADFWPGTGKFRVRDPRIDGRGVRNLLRTLHRLTDDKPLRIAIS